MCWVDIAYSSISLFMIKSNCWLWAGSLYAEHYRPITNIAHIRKSDGKVTKFCFLIHESIKSLYTFPSLLISCFETRNKKSKAMEK